jgi:hypothetical protein
MMEEREEIAPSLKVPAGKPPAEKRRDKLRIN